MCCLTIGETSKTHLYVSISRTPNGIIFIEGLDAFEYTLSCTRFSSTPVETLNADMTVTVLIKGLSSLID